MYDFLLDFSIFFSIIKLIPFYQRECIFFLVQEGIPSCSISSHKDVSYTFINRIRQKKKEIGFFNTIPKLGCLRILMECYNRNFAKLIKSDECSNTIQVQKSLIFNKNIFVSANTI